MTRAIAVIIVAALCAALLGVDESLSATQDDAARAAARQQATSTRVAKIAVGSVVKVERNDGTKLEGMLTAKTADSITIDVYQRRAFRRLRHIGTDTIPLDDIKNIKKPLTGKQQAAITAGVLAGTCAGLLLVVSSGLESISPQTLPVTETEQPPSADLSTP
jgi:hypothetical protein